MRKKELLLSSRAMADLVQTASPSGKNPVSTVLLVEDDEAVVQALQFRLELEGWRVQSYPSAEAMLAVSVLPDRACLVLDQILAGMSGLDLLASLRARGVSTPAIIITTNPSRAIRARVAASGATLIEKPLLGEGLTRAIRANLGE
jgi:two-component system C4-dicarboxylate transport response regulator DctD